MALKSHWPFRYFNSEWNSVFKAGRIHLCGIYVSAGYILSTVPSVSTDNTDSKKVHTCTDTQTHLPLQGSHKQRVSSGNGTPLWLLSPKTEQPGFQSQICQTRCFYL